MYLINFLRILSTYPKQHILSTYTLNAEGNYDVIPLQSFTIRISHGFHSDLIFLPSDKVDFDVRTDALSLQEVSYLIVSKLKVNTDDLHGCMVRFVLRNNKKLSGTKETLWTPQKFLDTYLFTKDKTLPTVAMVNKEADRYAHQGLFSSICYGEN